MSESQPFTILCLAGDVKGHRFMTEAKRLGCRVFLLTRKAHAKADWPREAIDEFFFLDSLLDKDSAIKGVSWLARRENIDRIVGLDDFDTETAAVLREHLRVPGMGDTTTRYFRDKLAMRMKAREAGIEVPDFVHVLNYQRVADFLEQTPAPWMMKPRSQAATAGISKLWKPEDVWRKIDELGDEQSHFLLEAFIPGDIYHVDSIIYERELVFTEVNRYGRPPLDVAHDGGIFITSTVERDSPEAKELFEMNRRVIAAMGQVRGVAHTEFIRSSANGRFYFLETAARVGGAHIAEVAEAATGINLWAEWAKIELAGGKAPYYLPQRRNDYAGIALCLARQEFPDTSSYSDPEIVWRETKEFHAGVIVASSSHARIKELLDSYARRFAADFLAVQPALEKIDR